MYHGVSLLCRVSPPSPLFSLLHRADTPSDLGTDMVTLLVGPTRVKFIVHKKLLVRQKIFFCGSPLAIGASLGADEGVVTLQDDDPDAFRLLIGWLYQGRIPRLQPYKPGFAELPETASSGLSLPVSPTAHDQDVDMDAPPEDSDPKTDSRKRIDDAEDVGVTLPELRVSATPSGAGKSTPSRRKGSTTLEPKQPKERVRLTPEVLEVSDQEAASPTAAEGIWESTSSGSGDQTGDGDGAVRSTETQHIPEDTPKSDMTPAKSPLLLASGLTPNAPTPARHSSSNEGATAGDTTAATPTARLTPLREIESRVNTWLSNKGEFSASSTTISSSQPQSDGRTQWGEESDRHQLGLVHLMAVADRFGLTSLFNDTMDAYMDGERVLNRTWIWGSHLQVAYTRCGPSSSLRELLCDRVLFEAANDATF